MKKTKELEDEYIYKKEGGEITTHLLSMRPIIVELLNDSIYSLKSQHLKLGIDCSFDWYIKFLRKYHTANYSDCVKRLSVLRTLALIIEMVSSGFSIDNIYANLIKKRRLKLKGGHSHQVVSYDYFKQTVMKYSQEIEELSGQKIEGLELSPKKTPDKFSKTDNYYVFFSDYDHSAGLRFALDYKIVKGEWFFFPDKRNDVKTYSIYQFLGDGFYCNEYFNLDEYLKKENIEESLFLKEGVSRVRDMSSRENNDY